MIRVAINGAGRIGRLVFRIMEDNPNFEVVAINDLTDAKQIAHLLKYDTSHGNFKIDEIAATEDSIIVGNRTVKIFSEKDPVNLPWGELQIDQVFECTGFFNKLEDALKHVTAGAKQVIISAPAKGDLKTIVYNVNDDTLDGSEQVVSAASCTTNCLAPVVNLLEKTYGIKKGYMTTVHAYTNDQTILDVAHKKGIDARRGRAGAANIVPSSTGAAKAIGLVIPSLLGKLDGGALRVPTTTGSVVDLTLELNQNTTVEEINNLFFNNQNVTLRYTNDPIVSSDIIGSTYGSIVDGQLTKILEVDGKQLVKVISWYDNEFSYSSQMVRTAKCLYDKSR
ncbi:MAG: type I glyceraldehyde-3-phosphate dehydrogenase [Mycoplasmatota bacterium]